MEEIVALKKKMQCQKCQKPYSATRVGYAYKQCHHHSCGPCLIYRKCIICDCSTDYAEIPFVKEMTATLEKYESLQNEHSTLKQEKLLLEAHHKCIECDKLYSDQDMQLCGTCHELKYEEHEDSFQSAYNFSSQSPKINLNSEEFKSARSLLKDTFTRFNALSSNVSENYDLLTDMAQRSKNTKYQVECFEKMEKFIIESKSINVEADSELKERVTKLENNLTEIKEWYKSRMGNCVDESEIVKLLSSDKNNTEVDA